MRSLPCVCLDVYYMYDQWIRYCSGVLPREPMQINVRLPSSIDLDAYASEQWEVQVFSLYSCLLLQLYISLQSYLGMFFRLFITYNIVTSEFPVAPYKLHGRWSNQKHQLLYDENIPERPFKSKVFNAHVLSLWFPSIHLGHISFNILVYKN